MFSQPLLLNEGTQYAELSISPDATAADIRDAKTELANRYAARTRALNKKLAAADGNGATAGVAQAIRDEIQKLDHELNDINSIKLEDEGERRKYDLATPPCALLKLAERQVPILTDRRPMLVALRRAVSAFVEEELNVPCYHPSDETRRTFVADFEPNQTLDQEAR
jgi:hypothetical protein